MSQNLDVETARGANLLSLVGGDLRKTGGGWWAGSCPLCGGTDRFVLHQVADGWRWLCRKCSPKYQDAIAFVMQRDHVSFAEAVKALGGGEALHQVAKAAAKPEAVYESPTAEWQKAATHQAMIDHERLLYGEDGRAGREFLERRGITLAAILYFTLGYNPERGAISIPHFRANCIQAIKYRHLQGDWRYSMAKGSKPLLFGIPKKPKRILLVCEGEINAISAWIESQRLNLGIDAVSPGSETLGEAARKPLQSLATFYQKTIVWFDAPERGKDVSNLVGASMVLRSPEIEGLKCDANALLQAGRLGAILQEVVTR